MERLSALMDGELGEHEVVPELARTGNDPERQAAWETYHLIGDVLRGEAVISTGMAEKVSVRLASEPTVLAPRAWRLRRTTRQLALPLAASVCGVALVGWLALSLNSEVQTLPDQAGTRVIASAQPVASETDRADDEAMAEYLMAHQQFSPSTAMQGVVPYVRTVAASDSAR